MNKQQEYIAAFDLDKTILNINSTSLLVRTAREIGLMNNRNYLQAIFLSITYKFDLQDPDKIVRAMTRLLTGLRESEIKKLIHENIIPVLKKLIRPEMNVAISAHKNKNARIILMSSAIPYICNPIGDYFKMDEVICSSMEVIDDCFTGHAKGKLVFGREKEVRLKEYCASNGFPLETTWYYGDAFTDRFVLQSVGNPVCVSPEMKLERLAKRHGWEIV